MAAGVRRIEAVTGRNVLRYIDGQEELLHGACAPLKVGNPAELPARVEALQGECKEYKKKLEAIESKLAEAQMTGMLENSQLVNGVRIASVMMNGAKIEALRAMGDKARDLRPDVVGVFATVNEGKGSILVVCGKDAVAKGAHAGKIVKDLTALCGGGRPDSAQGGTSEIFRIDEAMAQLASIVTKYVK